MWTYLIDLCLRTRTKWVALSNDLLWQQCLRESTQFVPFSIILVGAIEAFMPKLAWYSYLPNVFFIALGLVYYLRKWWFSRRLQAWADDFYRAQMELTVGKVMKQVKADLAAYPEQWDGSNFHRR